MPDAMIRLNSPLTVQIACCMPVAVAAAAAKSAAAVRRAVQVAGV